MKKFTFTRFKNLILSLNASDSPHREAKEAIMVRLQWMINQIPTDKSYHIEEQLDQEAFQKLLDHPSWAAGQCLDLDLNIHRLVGEGVYIKGKIRGSVHAQCVRCLQDFDLPFELQAEGTFLPKGAMKSLDEHGELDLEVEDLSLSFYEGDRIDIADFVRDTILLEMPMHPVCKEDCKGLCPQCGANLNHGPCGCTPEIDPRWAPLLAFKAKMNS